ncbi:uncharacterized protein [Amphiura filiformis]|uniref:uncharacterized protein n=1 Tax=Amphiura filiformis TaxID=82378 RepID=UPI003B228298
MEPDLDTYLRGFTSFGRSTSISVMVCDQSLQQAYHNALTHGEGTCNRQRTLIIGDKGVGKTSTLEMLTGSFCDPTCEPKSTEGIDITICETSDLSPEWQKSSGDKADDPKLSAAWLVCKDEDCFQGVLKNEEKMDSPKPTRRRGGGKALRRQQLPRNKRQGVTNDTGAVRKVLAAAFVLSLQLKCLLPLIAMVVLNRVGSGFAPFAWITVAGLSLFIDFNNAYRFGTACALQGILIDVISNVLVCEFEVTFNWDLLLGIGTVLISVCLVGVISFLCGVGGRTGMALAFCFMSRPIRIGSLYWPADVNWKPTAFMIVVHTVGHLLGVVMVRQAGMYMKSIASRLGYKKLLCTTISIAFMLFICQFYIPFGRYMVGFCLGCVAGIASLTGVLCGRAILTNREWLKDRYLTKKLIGFLVAIGFGQIIGWRIIYPFRWEQLVNISSFVLRDVYIGYRFHQSKHEGMPIDVLRDQLVVSSRGKDATIMKLIIWDFAGDSVYQFMQHFFFPKSAVFILVFNLEQALENLNQQVEKLKQWLHTVKAHSTVFDAIVFIVGTHRDGTKDHEGFLDNVTTCFRDSLYDEFCGILAINLKYEAPLFPVENSRPIDVDGVLLRETIKRGAKERPFLKQKQPIWYLRLLEIITNWKNKHIEAWYIKKDELIVEAAEGDITEEDVDNFLKFCHISGEFIYRYDDEVMKDYIILDPQYLLDIMTDLLNFPPLSERPLEGAEKWRTLVAAGVASVELLAEIIDDTEEMVTVVTRFLEAYNMLLPIRPANEARFSSCIVPSHLPDKNPDECWDCAPDDEVFYFDFGYVPSDVIFHRLLARCWYHHPDKALKKNVYRRCGIFRCKENPLFFMLQLQVNAIDQQLIKLVVQSSDERRGRCGVQVLQWVIAELEDIRAKDFPNLPFKVGPTCKICSDAQGNVKVLKLCGDGEEFPTANTPVRKFLEDGRYHEVRLVPRVHVLCGSRNRRTSSSSSTESSVPPASSRPGAVQVHEGSRDVTVIQAGDNATINVPHPRNENKPKYPRIIFVGQKVTNLLGLNILQSSK